ncbi:MAG: M20 family metallo-hydrolase [Candidatus Micrarchaeia archaeon]
MDIFERIDSYKKEMVSAMAKMIAIPAISPLSGGEGESKRADFLEDLLKKMGLEVKRFDYTDEFGKIRSNLIVEYGKAAQRIWILSHIDTVSPGDLSLWKHDPFDAYIKDGKIYGRGTNDDGQGVISSIFALKAVKEAGVNPKFTFGIALVADEEVGNEYGIKKLLKEGVFSKKDLAVVPDWGRPKGDEIEIAEKGILWLKFRVVGKQVHASTPEQGLNAYRVSVKLLDLLDNALHKRFNKADPLFEPPKSTFEMTKHEKNVESVNIIPGTETFFMDCRVLPNYKLDSVLALVKNISKRVERQTKAKIYVEVVSRDEALKPLPKNAKIIQILQRSIRQVKHKEARLVGIGGGTVAKFLRRYGVESAVWSSQDDVAHQPNEYAVISNMVDDTKIFASMFV